jgi:hypothetical protein
MEKKQLRLLEIANLEVDSKIGKDRHFIAAGRKNAFKTALGLVSVIGAALIASAAFKEALPLMGLADPQQKLAFSILSVLVGLSTAVLGFFGLEKQVTQHRIVGNRYIEVARKSRSLINEILENGDKPEHGEQFEKLLSEYLEVNREGESCPTSEKDSKKSMRLNAEARRKIKTQIKRRENEALGTNGEISRRSLRSMAHDSLRLKAAWALNKLYVISDKHYENYIKQF